MADWEDEDFEPAEIEKPVATDLWEGEDEEDDVKDNWDDDEGQKKPPAVSTDPKEAKSGKKKSLAKKLKEKEQKEAEALERKRLAELNKTPEEVLSDRLLNQKLTEESDLEVTKDTFGTDSLDPNKVTIDNFKCTTKEHFLQLEEMLTKKITEFESSPHYLPLIDGLFHNCSLSLDAESIKKVVSRLSVLQNEKAKQERQKKGGKKTNKAKLAGSTKSAANDDIIDYSTYDDLNDFM